MNVRVLHLQFQDECHPAIVNGWRFVEVKVGRKWVHLRDIEGTTPGPWKRIKRAMAFSKWPALIDQGEVEGTR